MSYYIVQSIQIDKEQNKVFITGADNNVYPRTPRKWHCSYYDATMAAKDYNSIDLDILEAYESGNFQAGGQNKYTRALEVLRHIPEYQKLDWRQKDWEAGQENRKDKTAFRAVLEKALQTPLPKEKYVITKEANGQKAYFYHRRNAGFCKWYYEQAKAKVFRYINDAEATKKYFTDSVNWTIEKL